MFDVVVVGLGPNGLSVLSELEKYSLNTIGLDKGEVCNHIKKYPKDMIFFSTAEKLTLDDSPMGGGHGSNPSLKDACDYYESFANRNNFKIFTFSKVEKISGSDNDFVLHLNKGRKMNSRKIVLTTGIYSNPNHLNLPGERSSNVSHYYSGSENLSNKNVLVVGAGNSAVEAALDLSIKNKVVLSCRKKILDPKKIKSWIYPKFIDFVDTKKIDFLNSSSLVSLNGSRAIFQIDDSSKGSVDFKFDFDYCFLLTGYKPDKRFLIKGCGLELEGELEVPKHNSESYETTVKGIYIAGALVEGMNSHRVFIENGRMHGSPIAKDIYEKLKN